jgi:hypothetical protein
MTADDTAIAASMKAQGFPVRGYASSQRGPFTATVYHEGLTYAGVGSNPGEALGRLAAKLDEAAA